MDAVRATLKPGTAIELWWADEARIGQKNTLTRLWARRGTRPRLPHDQRTAFAYIFGAICPAKGKGAGLVLPRCKTEAMNAHLAEISLTVARRAHAVLMLDGAGWHTAGNLVVPNNITLLPLPPRAPELNPPEHVEGGERVAVPARQLARQPRVHLLRRHRGSLLRGLEQAHRSALEDHVHRPAPLGASVMINAPW